MIQEAQRVEFGDYQTPAVLAREVAGFLKSVGLSPRVIVEPTCGLGAFVEAATEVFPSAQCFAFDINHGYVDGFAVAGERVSVEQQDFFSKDWKTFFAGLAGEILVIGNPPWVTNSGLGAIRGSNLPEKNNFQNHRGFAAKTGKANFDISEWMLIKLLESLGQHQACLAMLCKTATARKLLKHAWLHEFPVGRASLHLIDAQAHFQVAVDACLLVVHTGITGAAKTATVYRSLSFAEKANTLGLYGKELIANIEDFHRLIDLDGIGYYTWRSGVKHDAAKVMEFTKTGSHFCNGLQDEVAIEDTYLYPMLKSSDLANDEIDPTRLVLVTQKHPSDDTAAIREKAPATWKYLHTYGAQLDARQSIIYQKRARFSVFGVGAYTFAPWKVAISGMYKTLKFRVLGSVRGKPIVVDDTCYFIPCHTRQEAEFICGLLNSDLCQRFLRALVFLDAKRPVTIDVLNRIDLKRLAEKLGLQAEAKRHLAAAREFENGRPQLVFEKKRPSAKSYRASPKKMQRSAK
ncbi:MAG: hypothetical protein PCFJNLEI_02845 [Verrucomicrobiae bacterium]|nr:hypothetical protein [Verrucomicrobiae bacterium]